MKKRNIWRGLLALVLCLSMSMNAFAAAAGESGTVEVETSAGTTENVEVEITIQELENADGSTTVESQSQAEGYRTESGAKVDYSAESTLTTQEGGATTGEASEAYTVKSKDQDGTYTAQGGSEAAYTENTVEITIQMPSAGEEERTVVETGAEAGTVLETEGDVPESETDGTYDYTSTTVESQGSVSVEFGTGVVTENMEDLDAELEYAASSAVPSADNDLFTETNGGAELPAEGAELPEVEEGYRYVYIGTGNSSQFWAAYLFTSPSEDYPDEEPLYVDENGNGYYLRRGHNVNNRYKVEGLYMEGELVEADTKFPAWYDSIQQFVVVDSVTGSVLSTYCADRETPAEHGYSYNMENIEDADYYTSAEAAMIRTVALNGYWGTRDDPSTEELERGSLDAVRKMMEEATDAEGNPVFTEEEVKLLNDGIAMTATQFAIWSYSNYMSGVEFVNTQYVKKNADNQWGHSGPGSLNDVPASEQASVDLIFKLYDHLINMAPTPVADKTTSDTVINADSFISDMNLTVVAKAKDHVNNMDGDGTNDAYVTNLTFTLVVKPDEEKNSDEDKTNDDDLMVYVLDKDGNELAKGRLAGEIQGDETLLTPDDNGNYTLSDIVLIEGEQHFHITLKGIQNLEEGVYLYTSEVVDGVSSQTMVGMAQGERNVDVAMDIAFKLNVEQEVVATTRVWREEKFVPGWKPPLTNPNKPPTVTSTVNGSEVPEQTPPENSEGLQVGDLVEIPDTQVPLANIDVKPPKTGDISLLWMVLSAVSGMSLALLLFFGRKWVFAAPERTVEAVAPAYRADSRDGAPPGSCSRKGGGDPPNR